MDAHSSARSSEVSFSDHRKGEKPQKNCDGRSRKRGPTDTPPGGQYRSKGFLIMLRNRGCREGTVRRRPREAIRGVGAAVYNPRATYFTRGSHGEMEVMHGPKAGKGAGYGAHRRDRHCADQRDSTGTLCQRVACMIRMFHSRREECLSAVVVRSHSMYLGTQGWPVSTKFRSISK
jgi:hypothetical protein